AGCSENELVGQRYFDFTHPDDLAKSMAGFEELLRTGVSFVIEQRYVKPDGTVVWVQSNISRIDGPEGPTGVAAVVVDISEKRRIEQEVKQVAREREARV